MTVSVVAMMSVLLICTSSFVRAEGADPQPADQKDVTAEKILVDVFLLRPVGIVATAFGAATYLVTLPFTLPTNSHDTVGKKLVGDAWDFTFKRPVGHLK
jgi:hypothetical protein